MIAPYGPTVSAMLKSKVLKCKQNMLVVKFRKHAENLTFQILKFLFFTPLELESFLTLDW
jgi:hypothetical protein